MPFTEASKMKHSGTNLKKCLRPIHKTLQKKKPKNNAKKNPTTNNYIERFYVRELEN